MSTSEGKDCKISLVCNTIWNAYLKNWRTREDTSITRQETKRETMVFFLQYRLCKNFWFLKSSIIFFTKSKVTTSPSILAPEYCGSTSSIKTKHQIWSFPWVKLYATVELGIIIWSQKEAINFKDHRQYKIKCSSFVLMCVVHGPCD